MEINENAARPAGTLEGTLLRVLYHRESKVSLFILFLLGWSLVVFGQHFTNPTHWESSSIAVEAGLRPAPLHPCRVASRQPP